MIGRAAAAGVLLASGLVLLDAVAAADAPGPPVPAGWRELPELVAAPEVGGVVRIESRRGLGDPASGCFALVQRVSAPAAVSGEAAARALADALAATGLAVERAGEDLRFSGQGVEGTARTVSRAQSGERVVTTSAACFYNDREPARCRVRCDALLNSLGGAP